LKELVQVVGCRIIEDGAGVVGIEFDQGIADDLRERFIVGFADGPYANSCHDAKLVIIRFYRKAY
jgi:hypothetical protein